MLAKLIRLKSFAVHVCALALTAAIAPVFGDANLGPVGPSFDVVKTGKSPYHVQYDFYTNYLDNNGYLSSTGGTTKEIFLKNERRLYEQAVRGQQDAVAIYAMGAMGYISFKQQISFTHNDPYQQRAFKLLKSLDDTKDPTLSTLLSLYYRYGLGVQPNPIEADRYFNRALILGDIAALNFHTFSLIKDKEVNEAMRFSDRLISSGDVMGYVYKTVALESKVPIPDRDSDEARNFFDAAIECWEASRIANCGFLLVNASRRFNPTLEDKKKIIDVLIRLINKKPADHPVEFQSIDTNLGLNTRLFLIHSAIKWGYLNGHASKVPPHRDALYDLVTKLESRIDSIPYPWKSDVIIAYYLSQTRTLYQLSDLAEIEKSWNTASKDTRDKVLLAARHINRAADEIPVGKPLRISDIQILYQASINSFFGIETEVNWQKASKLSRLASTAEIPAANELRTLSEVFNGKSAPTDATEICKFTCFILELIAQLESEYERTVAAAKAREEEALRQAELLREAEIASRQREEGVALQRQEARAREERRLAVERDRQRRRDNVSGFLNFAADALTAMVVVGAIVYTAGAIAPLLIEDGYQTTYSASPIRRSALPSACYSDFDCGLSSSCLKKQTAAAGFCAKTVNQYGTKVLTPPNPSSTRVGGAVNRCNSFQQCPIGFTCNLEYKVCVQ